MNEFNGFDEIKVLPDDAELMGAKDEQEHNRVQYLVHKVFAQSESGRELLELWKETLINTPTLEGHSTKFEAGLNEGEKRFVRSIILNIKQVEES